MAPKESKIEQISRNVEHLITPCVQGVEVVSPTDLAAYLRLQEEGLDLPPDVAEHLRLCVTCQDNRAFIRKTDPILHRFRKKRVELMIRDVLEEEKAEKELEVTLANARTNIPAAQQNDLANKIEASLSPANDQLVQEAEEAASKVPSGAPLEVGRQITDISVKVGAILDPDQRGATTKKVSVVFRGSARRCEKLGILTPKSRDEFIDKLTQPDADWIDLSTLSVPLDVATAFLTGFPETCYFGDRHLLRKSGNTIQFNWALCQQLRRAEVAAIAMS